MRGGGLFRLQFAATPVLPTGPAVHRIIRFFPYLSAAVALWPYMVPLLLVYFAEYAMQSGTWTAIGKTSLAV